MRLLRRLHLSPWAALTLALGMALNVAVFAVAYNLLFAPPALVRDPATLLSVSLSTGRTDAGALASYPAFESLRGGAPDLVTVAAHAQRWGTARTGNEAVRVSIVLAGASFFDVLGVTAVRGRTFAAADDGAGSLVSVVNESLADRLGAEAIDIGKPLAVNGVWTTIVGIVPRRFIGVDARRTDVWVPLAAVDQLLRSPMPGLDLRHDRELRWLSLTARLRPGVSPAAAQSRLGAAFGGGARVAFDRPGRLSATDRTAVTALTVIVQSAVAILILIAMANAAALTHARNLGRRREFAIRMALGSSRARLIGGLLADGLALGIAALIVAVPLSTLATSAFVSYAAGDTFGGLLLDLSALVWPVLAAAGALTIVVGVGATLVPAVRTIRGVSADTLQKLAPGIAGGLTRSRRALVVFQTAMAVTLLLAIGLLLQTRDAIHSTPSGLDARGVSFAKVEPQRLGYDSERARRLATGLFDRLRSEPEIRDVTLARLAPLQSNGWAHPAEGDGRPATGEMVEYNVVSPNYFDFFGIPIVDGQGFSARRDVEQAEGVAVINETMARTWWPNGRAVGSRLHLGGEPAPRTVVGVARDVKYTGLMRPSRAYFYLPMSQKYPLPEMELTIHFRPRGALPAAEAAVARAVAGQDPDLPLTGGGTIEAQVAREAAVPTLLASFVSLVAAIALILVCLGLHASLAQIISHSRKEMAIRVALGASYAQLQWLLARRVLISLALGAVFGWGVGGLAAGALSRILVNARVMDPRLIAMVLAALAACAVLGVGSQLWRLAGLVPSRVLHED